MATLAEHADTWEDADWPLRFWKLPTRPKETAAPFQDGEYLGTKSHNQRVAPIATSPGEVAESLDFLKDFPPGDAIIQYHGRDGHLGHISNINLLIVEATSALLPHAFQETRSGPCFYSEVLSPITAPGFVRFLYTGTYAPSSSDGVGNLYDDVPTSLLLHCQMYRLGDTFDMPDLRTQAYVNVLRQCEFGCSSPDKPIDLCEAIRFAYQSLSGHELLIDAIVNYCVECLLTHRLPEDADFADLVYELRVFAQDLNINVRRRGFEAETAQAIIQLRSKIYAPETYASREDIPAKRMSDIVFHFHGEDEYDSPSKRRKNSNATANGPPLSFHLPTRESKPIKAVENDERKPIVPKLEQSEDSRGLDWEILEAPVNAVKTLDSSTEDESEGDDFDFERIPLINAAARPATSALSDLMRERAESESDSDWSKV